MLTDGSSGRFQSGLVYVEASGCLEQHAMRSREYMVLKGSALGKVRCEELK